MQSVRRIAEDVDGEALAALVIIFYIATIVRFGHHASGLMPTNLM